MPASFPVHYHRRVSYNEKWKGQKEKIREKLSDERMGDIYGKRDIDVAPVFGFLKAHLRFTRFSVRGKEKVKNEMGLALMAVNMRKYTAMNSCHTTKHQNDHEKKECKHQRPMNAFLFRVIWLVMFQPLLLPFYK